MKWTENGITYEATAEEFIQVWNAMHPAPEPAKRGKRVEITIIGHAGDEHKFETIKAAATYLSLATQRTIYPSYLSKRTSNTLYVKDYMTCNKEWNTDTATTKTETENTTND